MKYDYHGSEDTGLRIDNPLYPKIHSPQEMYESLSEIWCEFTCAPRMRKDWSKENRTLGQCSVTAFLVQDVFGGEVYGIPLKEGGYHCFNVADGHLFDLTSAQFKEKLDYNDCVLQKREVHFAKQEKYKRYLYLKKEFEMKMSDE